ncbi:DUF5318 family protein [Corynebacterium felinum]|uniref:DUF5318 domain-containing protein n=1 Tax=Corynebacterium felinum TaxID=131318 RepID=A0ABU2B6D7_9CORY|nr:DUF5318 family protein [Corynebacterium felinum]MDF5820595.1 DUF5318 family protein [Corynebacterium felinum]MDR7354168.1 hypothetical protein [Corynebacterium felinum]WJY96339.1 hypothetical protein CFELI_13840 [Corynebacterium felinum]
MVDFHGHVTHKLARARVLAAWRSGHIDKENICDAEFLLVAAAKYHGTPVNTPCPICEHNSLREVFWVYGDELGRMSGSARSLEEIERFVQNGLEFTVHNVEVCPNCKWNHLIAAAIAAPTGTTDGAK